MGNKNKEGDLESLLQSIRNTLLDVREQTRDANSMTLLVTRRRLLVVNIIANTLIKNINSLLEQESELEDID